MAPAPFLHRWLNQRANSNCTLREFVVYAGTFVVLLIMALRLILLVDESCLSAADIKPIPT